MRAVLLVAAIALFAAVAAEDDAADGIQVETEPEENLAEYQSPQVDPEKVFIAEHFDDDKAFWKHWVLSEARKQGVDEDIAKYNGVWEIQSPTRKILKNDLGLVLTTEAKHAAISRRLNRPFNFSDKPLIVQYEVTMQEGQSCGGAYLKLLSKGSEADLKDFHDQTPYTIMFGPDKCGNDNKLHFIFRHVNPKNGSIEEKHAKKPTSRLEDLYKDKQPHLYTLIVRPDNSFSVLVDGKEVNAGSLLADMTPPVNPPEEIDDPNDVKPEDWDEREKIVDPTATKPDDWDESAPAHIPDPSAVKPDGWLDDEPEMIPDPDAKKPADWDVEMDGEWEPPLIENPACAAAPGCGPWSPPTIPNPQYKGVWRAPLIPNPNYKGKWTPRRIRNPHYFKDDHPFKMTPIHAIGFELWSMTPALLFDNLIVTDDESVAAAFSERTFALKRSRLDRDADSLVTWLARVTNENPWLWAVYLIVIITFVAMFAYLCCSSSKDDATADADAKKTDAPTADDAEGSDADNADNADADNAEDDNADADNAEDANADDDNADVDNADTDNADADNADADKAEKEAQTSASKSQLGEPEHSSAQEETTSAIEGGGDGARKRKPRKE